jgi:hypothetical protein
MNKNIGYHTRCYADNTVKVSGGSFGGSFDTDTVERLVKAHYTVIVKPSGACVFVDREGREVSVYLTVSTAETEAGKDAIKAHNEANRKAWAEAEEAGRKAQDEIDSLVDGLSREEIVRRLKG